jgi:hypothetical protein
MQRSKSKHVEISIQMRQYSREVKRQSRHTSFEQWGQSTQQGQNREEEEQRETITQQIEQ